MSRFCVFVLVCLFAAPVGAEMYVTGGVGQTRFEVTTPDGTWYQESLPYQHTKQDLGWKAGLGYNINESWGLEINYVNFGAVTTRGKWTSLDSDYDPINHATIKTSGGHNPPTWWAQGGSRMWGVAFVARRSWDVYGFRPFLSGGGWVGRHSMDINLDTHEWEDERGHHVKHKLPYSHHEFSGLLVGLTGGGGLCYRGLCGQVDYYKAVTQSGIPISTSIIMPTVTIQIPLNF